MHRLVSTLPTPGSQPWRGQRSVHCVYAPNTWIPAVAGATFCTLCVRSQHLDPSRGGGNVLYTVCTLPTPGSQPWRGQRSVHCVYAPNTWIPAVALATFCTLCTLPTPGSQTVAGATFCTLHSPESPPSHSRTPKPQPFRPRQAARTHRAGAVPREGARSRGQNPELPRR